MPVIKISGTSTGESRDGAETNEDSQEDNESEDE